MSDPVSEIVNEVKAELAKRNVLLSYWCKLFENFSFSPQELYATVERNLEARKVPGLEPDAVLIRQGGPFSPKRLYLQLRRERLVFEIGAAPFGAGFFVSSRLFDRRREPSFWDFMFLLLFLGLCGAPVAYRFGWVWSVITVTGILALLWTIMRLAALETMAWFDRVLSDLPFIGPLYDRFFHPDTYYRQDTNNAYRETVHQAVMQAVDEMRTQKGLKPLTDDERRPTLGEFHGR